MQPPEPPGEFRKGARHAAPCLAQLDNVWVPQLLVVYDLALDILADLQRRSRGQGGS